MPESKPYSIGAVSPEQAESYWPLIKPFIEPALKYEHEGTTADDILDLIILRRCCCFLAYDSEYNIVGCQTAEVHDEPDGFRIFNLVTTAGHDVDNWQDPMLEACERVARELDCEVIQTRGRLGWFKQLKRNGFAPKYFIAEKKLNG